MNPSSSLLSLLSLLLLFSSALSFQSDEFLHHDDDEFEGVRSSRDPAYVSPPVRRRPDLDLSSASDSKSVQFTLEHALGDSDFSVAGTFTARLKSWTHGGQTLTKLRFTRNAISDAEKGLFERLLKEDDFYTIRIPSNVLNPSGKDYVVSSVRARCLPRESLDEHFVIHTDGVNVLAVNYGSAGGCQYPRPLKFPAKWSFSSYTVLKNGEQAPRTPTFVEQLIASESPLEEGVKPPEKSFWAKYWMYVVPLGFVVMNAMAQATNAAGEDQNQGGQPAQRAPAVRRR
ncbi:ER membrane protein complex subunit 10-like protein [Carex littledalei]|uniref:ER membrane protein complex subunit 10 n=1 Tax=Carex littledalei TaxID=544730 RepID=A0A833QZV4_9POAL|nr:ER membrane protein complex subunit 10-like protein [Carex littledalei]